jgi:endo-1,4-beta-xylanase
VTGAAGTTGVAGTTAGTSGGAGTTGVAGTSAAAGTTGAGGTTGAAGTSAAAGTTGAAGTSSGGGTTGAAGAAAGRGGTTATGGRGGGSGGSGAGGGSGGRAGSTAGAGGGGGTASACPPQTPPTGGTRYCSNSKGNSRGGYSYELWAEGTGSGCMTVYGSDAKFSANWSGVEDFLARMGLQFDQTRTPAQIGTITADFAERKTGNDGLVYVGVYGWTVNPLKEYYILDDWGDVKPAGVASDGTPRTNMGTIVVDGETYDVWKKLRVNKPNITGTDQDFEQYFSIRQTARQCGRITVSEHISKWITLGMPLGRLVEATLLVEAQSSTGTIDFTTGTVVVR